ncbi:MAG: SdpI family protein [Eubacteriales bacterium]
MGFWIFMVIMLLLIPITMIGFGKYFIKSASKEINMVFGYRTSMSMKNKETWQFAHNYCGKIWYNTGKILLLSVLLMFFVIGKSKDTIGNLGLIIEVVQMFLLIGSIFPTERALRKNFDKNGNRIK